MFNNATMPGDVTPNAQTEGAGSSTNIFYTDCVHLSEQPVPAPEVSLFEIKQALVYSSPPL